VPAGLIAAFGAGVLSFVSPCVLPLVPGYISFVTSATLGGSDVDARPVRGALVPALLFVAGFSFVFVTLGASASLLGSLLTAYRELLARVSGVLIFAFGVLLLGVIKAPWLQREARFDLARSRSLGRWAAPVMGMAFAFGWTPCVGPILGSILVLAGATRSIGQGVALLLAYSAGLGVPFVAAALLLGRLTGAMRWFRQHAVAIDRAAGVVLMLLGVAIATNTLGAVAAALARYVSLRGIG
jgi:cytochrome c-type biogenesis protein